MNFFQCKLCFVRLAKDCIHATSQIGHAGFYSPNKLLYWAALVQFWFSCKKKYCKQPCMGSTLSFFCYTGKLPLSDCNPKERYCCKCHKVQFHLNITHSMGVSTETMFYKEQLTQSAWPGLLWDSETTQIFWMSLPHIEWASSPLY